MHMIFDAHCDTSDVLYENNAELKKNNFHIDLNRMKEYKNYIQVFAAYIDKKNITCSPMNRCIALIEKITTELEADNVPIIKDNRDLEVVRNNFCAGALLSIEGAEALEGNLSALWMYYRLGVRLITLTWNYANELADGITEPRGGGLTDFGKEVVKMMEHLGMMTDVSHLSVNGFWDVAEISAKPFIASHSCVKALCNHPRNLNDEQIKFMIKHGCGIGINFYPEFLTDSDSCSISDIINHMKYIIDMGGDKTIGFGSDFDGVDALPDGIYGAQSMADVLHEMSAQGFTDNQIDNISFNNFYRIFSEVLN